jgi:hypothetical protein
LRKLTLPQFGESRLGAGFDQPELGWREAHFPADLLGRLLLQIEAYEYFPIAFVEASQNVTVQTLIFFTGQNL